MVELRPTHHLVLWCAVDALPLAALLSGVSEVIGSGERFPIVPPIPADDARDATLELLEAGAVTLSFFDHTTGDSRSLDTAEARRVASDPATWRIDVPASAAHSHELFLTSAGEELFAEAHRRFGTEMEATAALICERSAEFLERHPDFVEKNRQYLDAMTRWVERGGQRPTRPRFD